MSISVADFWRLLVESRLMSADEARQAAEELARTRPGAAKDLQQVARSLLQAGKISLYQAKVLAAGKPGPFVHGDYLVYDRVESPRLSSLVRARHQPTKHPVCLSFLSGQAAQNPQALMRLMPQLAVARQASQAQPRLSACYEFVDQGTSKFLVVENLRGDSLDQRLKKPEARLSITAACRVVRLAALGLAQLHSLGQAHGHVRPENIWLDESGAAKLLQFPLIGDPLTAKAPPVNVKEQLDYLAPELASAGTLADARSDVYGLGCLLYHLLAGQPPFAGGDTKNKLARHAKEPPAAIAKLNPQTPAALAQVLSYLLQKDPAKRYPDAAAVAEALAAYAGDDPQATTEPTLPGYEAWLARPSAGGAPAAAQPAAAVAVAAVPYATAQPVRAVPAGAFPIGSPPIATAAPAMPAMSVAAPLIAPVAGDGSVLRRRPRKSGQAAVTAGVIVGAVALLAGVVWFLNSENAKDIAPPTNTAEQGVAANTASQESPEAAPEEVEGTSLDAHVVDKTSGPKEPVQGIGGSIWQSPTTGSPLNLSWLPPGVQVILALRPAELARQEEWPKLIDRRTLGTLSQWLTDDLPKTTGKTLDQLDSVMIGLLDGSPGPPKVALVARASDEFSLDEMQASWSDAKPEEIEGQVIHVQSQRAFYIPPSGADKLLVIAPAADLRDMLKTGGEPPPLRREVEILAESSDDQRHLTLLAAPNFPLTDGKALFVDEGVKLLEPLRVFLEMQDTDGKLEMTKALMFSCHLGDSLFLELRMYDNFGKAPQS
ncbi:MAG: serine/threonine protein kinase, partial [Pirellulales bacterium]